MGKCKSSKVGAPQFVHSARWRSGKAESAPKAKLSPRRRAQEKWKRAITAEIAAHQKKSARGDHRNASVVVALAERQRRCAAEGMVQKAAKLSKARRNALNLIKRCPVKMTNFCCIVTYYAKGSASWAQS